MVDYFVLIEATHTFSGQPKPLHFANRGDRVTWSYDQNYQLTCEHRSGTNAYNVTLYGSSKSSSEKLIIR